MKNLYFIRHGESTANIINLTGTDDAMLTENGIKQATDAGKAAKKEELEFDVIISSSLPRALDTAKLVAHEIDYTKDPLDIGFNVTYLIDVLNNVNDENIHFSFADANSSCLITVPNDTEYKYVVMPMRI